MATSRNEYLKALNRMRNNYQNAGNPLINTEDDSTNVGEELSSFAYMNTEIPSVENIDINSSMAINKDEQQRNVWQRTIDTGIDALNQVRQGGIGVVGGLFDAAIGIAGEIGKLFGASDQWAKDVIAYDWEAQALNAMNKTDLWGNVLTGDIFTSDYLQSWKDVFSADKSREQLNKTQQSSFASEMGTSGQETYNTILQAVGNILPTVAIGVATGGASIGVQAAVQAGTAVGMGVSAMGNQIEQALGEGATLEQALGSGAISGALETGVEFASFGLGKGIGALTSRIAKGGGKIAQVVAKSTQNLGKNIGGSTFLRAVASSSFKELGQAAVEEGLEEVVTELLSPLAESVYKGKEAWDVYKDGTIAKDAIMAFIGGAIGSAVGGSITSTYARSRFGKDYNKISNTINVLNDLTNELENAQKSGNVSQETINELQTNIGENISQLSNIFADMADNNPQQLKNIMDFFGRNQKQKQNVIEKQLGKSSIQRQYELTPQDIINAYKSKQNIVTDNLKMDENVAEKIAENPENLEKVNNFLDIVENEDNITESYVFKDKDTNDFMIVDKVQDQDGQEITAVIKADENYENVTDIQVYDGDVPVEIQEQMVEVKEQDLTKVKKSKEKLAEVKTTKLSESDRLPTYTEIVKDSANLKQAKVYNLSTVQNMVDNVLKNMLDKFDNATKIKVKNSKDSLIKSTFAELNLTKDLDRSVEAIMDSVLDSTITFDNGENGTTNLTLREVSEGTDLQSDLEKAIRGLIEHKGNKSEMQKFIDKYNDTVARYAQYVKDRADLMTQFVQSVKLKKTLDNKFADTKKLKLSGEDRVQEITLFKNLVDGIQFSIKRRNVSPNSFTRLVDNFKNYNVETFGEQNYDVSLKMLVDELSKSFVDGKFPNREPTVDEAILFNAILGRVNQKTNEMIDEKRQKILMKYAEGTRIAGISLPSVKPKSYGKIKSIADSALSLPKKVENVLGMQHPFSKLLTTKYFQVSAERYSKIADFKNQSYDSAASEVGLTEKQLGKALKKKIRLNDESLSINDLVGLYWTDKTAHDQLLEVGLRKYDDKNQTYKSFKFTQEQLDDAFKLIPDNIKQWADIVLSKVWNGSMTSYTQQRFKDFFGFTLPVSQDGTYVHTQRVGQVNTGIASASSYDAGYLATMVQGFLKERVKNSNPYLWSDATSMLNNHIDRVVSWAEYSPWIEEIRYSLNTKVDGKTLQFYLDEYVPEWKTVWSPYMSKIILGKPILEKNHPLLEYFGNVGQIMTLGLNIGTVLRQGLSDFAWLYNDRVTFGMWLRTFPQAIKNFFLQQKISNELQDNNGYFVQRFNEREVIKAILNGKMPNKIAEIVLKPMEWLDKTVITSHGYALAREIVKKYYGLKPTDADFNKQVSSVLQELTIQTQSNSDPMFMSRIRSGDAGWLTREIFGRFQSDNQNKAQALDSITIEKSNSDKRIKALEDYLQNNPDANQEIIDSVNKAIEAEKPAYRTNYGGKVSRIVASMILGSLFAVLIGKFIDKLYGREKWTDYDLKQDGIDLFLEATINWLPIVGTFANAIENNSEVSVFTVEKLNNLTEVAKNITNAFTTQDEKSIRKALINLFTTGLEMTGIPANNIINLVLGVWNMIDKESALVAKSWIKNFSSSSVKSYYNDAIKNGDTKSAASYLGAWTMLYSNNITDNRVLDEISRLSTLGYNAVPKANITSYVDESGEKISFTVSQSQIFNKEYIKSSQQASQLMNLSDFSNESDEVKAKSLRKLFDTYYDYAKAKSLGIAPSGKLAQLLYMTNGDIDLAKYILGLQKISSITADENKTKKEKVLESINKMKTFTKNEKLLLACLNGYSISEKNKLAVISYLMSLGFDRKEAEQFIQ